MKRKAPLAVALMHYPILDRQGELCATNITNFDIHDIARSCRVYGVERYYLIHPMQEQLMFVERVLDHWRTGEGSKMNPMRRTALTDVRTAPNLAMAMKDWGYPQARVVATHARLLPGQEKFSFERFKTILEQDSDPYMLVFGTGFGLTTDFMKNCHAVLDPIKGDSKDDYRHLCVRAAVSICLDRLLGTW
ncbi:MAG: RNA methyltransferase [Pseudobdellovibrio sp.]